MREGNGNSRDIFQKKNKTKTKNFETFVEEPLAQLSERLNQIILESNANFKANVHLNETALDNIQSI